MQKTKKEIDKVTSSESDILGFFVSLIVGLVISIVEIIDFIVNTTINIISNIDINIHVVLEVVSLVTMFMIASKNIDTIILILKETNQLKNRIKFEINKNIITNYQLNFMFFVREIVLFSLPEECQEHLKDEIQNILEINTKYIAYYKVIKLCFWEMLLLRIMNEFYLRTKSIIFISFIK